ncbi:non-specific lipid transfer protein GPI-anchored 1 [Panicum miliaceum]|uniref:Non-specific lipid transfer protein GPI-anchored 1 n=1 Tax=Panicum miliaceum TaxID=4540 RepID=A0A3L6QAZ1_PANMI|nr:non-specific lipid transfer protein GPI-anchored 1 [Panicum miliaceum]
MAVRRWWLAAAVSAAQPSSPRPAADPLQAKCAADFAKLTDCMDYTTGHAGSPSPTCCGDAADTQKARPQCLCYSIQQVHSGRNEVQSLGLRFDRLMALPRLQARQRQRHALHHPAEPETWLARLRPLHQRLQDHAIHRRHSGERQHRRQRLQASDGGPRQRRARHALCGALILVLMIHRASCTFFSSSVDFVHVFR